MTIDVSWFPIKKAIKVKNDEDQEDEKKDQYLEYLKHKLDTCLLSIE